MKFALILVIVCLGAARAADPRVALTSLLEDSDSVESDTRELDLTTKLIEKSKKQRRLAFEDFENRTAAMIREEIQKLSQSLATKLKGRENDTKRGPCAAPWKWIRKDLCILIPELQLNWTDASKYCESQNGKLLLIRHSLDFTAVKRIINRQMFCPWIGLRQIIVRKKTEEILVVGKKRIKKERIVEEKKFEWIDGVKVKWHRWGKGQPDFKDHKKRVSEKMCVALCSQGMVDQPCHYESTFFCYKPAARLVV